MDTPWIGWLLGVEESRWMWLLLDVSVRGVLVLATAGLFNGLVLRQRSAAWRHFVWLSAMAVLLLLPIMTWSLPRVSVFMLPAHTPPVADSGEVSSMQGATTTDSTDDSTVSPDLIALPPLPESLRTELHSTTEAEALVDSTPLTADRIDAPQTQSMTASSPVIPARSDSFASHEWSTLALLIWLAGATGVCGYLLVGALMVRRYAACACPESDPSWLALLDDVRERLGLMRPVRLLRSHRNVMPMTWGVRRPVILIPADADEWPADRRRTVLTHEAAHVKRLDCLTQWIADAATIVFWFHPLIWLADRAVRVERERACDDAVLAAGMRASDYAQMLVTLAKQRRPSMLVSRVALAMAKPSILERRVVGILDQSRRRGRVSGGRALAVAILIAAMAAPLAMLTPARAQSEVVAGGSAETVGPSEEATNPVEIGATGGKSRAAVESLPDRHNALLGGPGQSTDTRRVQGVKRRPTAGALNPRSTGVTPTTKAHVRIDAHVYEGPAALEANLMPQFSWTDPGTPDGLATVVIDNEGFKQMVDAVEKTRGAVAVSMPKVVATVGEPANLHIGEQIAYVSGMKLEQGEDFTVTYKPVESILNTGFRLRLTPTLPQLQGDNDLRIVLRIEPAFAVLREMRRVPYATEGESGDDQKHFIEQPSLAVTRFRVDTTLRDGQRLAVLVPPKVKKGSRRGKEPIRLLIVRPSVVALVTSGQPSPLIPARRTGAGGTAANSRVPPTPARTSPAVRSSATRTDALPLTPYPRASAPGESAATNRGESRLSPDAALPGDASKKYAQEQSLFDASSSQRDRIRSASKTIGPEYPLTWESVRQLENEVKNDLALLAEQRDRLEQDHLRLTSRYKKSHPLIRALHEARKVLDESEAKIKAKQDRVKRLRDAVVFQERRAAADRLKVEQDRLQAEARIERLNQLVTAQEAQARLNKLQAHRQTLLAESTILREQLNRTPDQAELRVKWESIRAQLLDLERALAQTQAAIETAKTQEVKRANLAAGAARGVIGVAVSNDDKAVKVVRVLTGGPAHQAGLQVGDLITTVDNTAVSSISALFSELAKRAPGQAVAVGIRRGNQSLVKPVLIIERAAMDRLIRQAPAPSGGGEAMAPGSRSTKTGNAESR